jgi:hypothetical protein
MDAGADKGIEEGRRGHPISTAAALPLPPSAYTSCMRDAALPGPGLCRACAHARLVTSARGSPFVLCALSASDGRFAKYPRLPVVACAGFEAEAAAPGASATIDAEPGG